MTVSFKLRGIGRFIKHIQGWKKLKKTGQNAWKVQKRVLSDSTKHA